MFAPDSFEAEWNTLATLLAHESHDGIVTGTGAAAACAADDDDDDDTQSLLYLVLSTFSTQNSNYPILENPNNFHCAKGEKLT